VFTVPQRRSNPVVPLPTTCPPTATFLHRRLANRNRPTQATTTSSHHVDIFGDSKRRSDRITIGGDRQKDRWDDEDGGAGFERREVLMYQRDI
jgi:hypothetical protein